MTAPTPPVTATLLVSCGDRTGLVAALSEFVFENGGNILDADQHAEVETGLFFMRLVWDLAGFKLTRPTIRGRWTCWRSASISPGRSPTPTCGRGSPCSRASRRTVSTTCCWPTSWASSAAIW